MTTAADLLELSDDALAAEVGKLEPDARKALIAEWEKLFAVAQQEHAEFCQGMPPAVERDERGNPVLSEAGVAVARPVDPGQQAQSDELRARAVRISLRLDRLRRIVKAADLGETTA